MKTNYFITKKAILKSLLGFIGLSVVACSSYQNKSYYDNDGIYGGEKKQTSS